MCSVVRRVAVFIADSETILSYILKLHWFQRVPSSIDPASLEAGLRALGGLLELTYLTMSLTPRWLKVSCKATVADVITADGFFLKLRSLWLDG